MLTETFRRIPFLKAALLALAALMVCAPHAQAAFDTRAGAAFVYDVTTDTILFEKNADEPLPPASMSKLMTLYMLFDALRDGRIAMDTEFAVSTKAKNMGGSTMFLNELDRPTAEELIQGIVVSSGNDATVVVAEGLAGTEDAFAREMNRMAGEIGLANATFVNASGWPAPNHRMSVRDLGILATHLVQEFPEYYGYFAQEEFDYKDRSPANRFNRNPLLGLGLGADGLKTGHTEEAGYGLVGSAMQGGRRLVFVVAGLQDMRARGEESERILSWAFRQFVEKPFVTAGTRIADADVWMGDQTSVGLMVEKDTSLLVAAGSENVGEMRVEYDGPLEPPFEKGQVVAELVVERLDLPAARIPLVADRAVGQGGILPRLRTSATVLFRKAMTEAQGLF